jgi:hypothetical protein
LKISDCAARAGLGEFPRTQDFASKPCLVSGLSLASYLATGQGVDKGPQKAPLQVQHV